MRDIDDRVIYSLNNSLPTASIKARTESNPETNCKGFYDSLRANYANRSKGIQECIVITTAQVNQLKQQSESSNDIQIEKRFKSEQRKVSSISVSLIKKMCQILQVLMPLETFESCLRSNAS